MSNKTCVCEETRGVYVINHNPYQNVFQLTLKFYRAVDVIVLLMHFAHTALFTLSDCSFPKNPLQKCFLQKIVFTI